MQEWNIYCDWHNFLLSTLGGLKLDGIVYLRAQPEVCYERLNARNRKEASVRPHSIPTLMH